MFSATKPELRLQARAIRQALASPDFAAALARHADALGLEPGAIVGGYHALKDEADPSQLLAALVEQGCHVAFPRVAARDTALEFHRVPDGEVLQPGAFGVHEPLAHWPLVIPDILLVPLLAFDVHGTRLGYGGGFYDRTLSQLRVRAIGVAYASQRMELLPRDSHDHPLDAVLTENGLHQISGTSR